MAFHIAGMGSGGGSLVYPDSAARPFNSNTARNNWANNNKQDLIKDSTVVNVDGNQWYLWTGQSNPQTVDSSLWMDAAEIIEGPQGEKGDKGDKGDAGGKLPYVLLNNSQGNLNESTDGQTYDLINLGVFDGVWSSINPQTEISGGPNPPDGDFDIIDSSVPVEFVQDVNNAVTPNYAKQWMTVYQGTRQTTYFRGGTNLVGHVNDIANANWSVVNMIPVAVRESNASGISFTSSRVLAMGGGLQSDFQGDTAILKSLAPYSDIVINTSSFEIGIPDDGKTLVYENSNPTDQDFIWLNVDADDVPIGFSVTIVNNPGSLTSPEIFIGTARNPFIPLIPGSGITVKKFEGASSFNFFKISGAPFKKIDNSYLDFAPEIWKDLAQNTYHTEIGTISNMDPSVDGKQARVIAQVYNTDQGEDLDPVVYHLYTVISDDQDINGLKFSRSGLLRTSFLNAPMIKVGSGDAENGFTLNQSAVIATTDENGVTSNSFGFIGPGNFFVGPINNEHDTTIQGKDAIYANLANGDVKKILLEGDAPGGDGFPDNGVVNNLSTSFDDLAVGKWYVDGWEDSSGLPNDWDLADRVACLTNFGGYDDKVNGSFSILSSHRKGVYAYAFSSGVGVPAWLRLDNATQVITSSSPLEVRRTGGGDHDAIGVTDSGTLVIGTVSSEIVETQFRSSQRRFSADVRNSDDTAQTLEQIAYVSDITKLEGSAIQWQRIMDAEPISTGVYTLQAVDAQTGQTVKSGPDDWVTMSYFSVTPFSYSVQLGMVKARKVTRNEDYDFYNAKIIYDANTDTFTMDVTENAAQLSFDFSINAANRIQLDQQIIKQGAKEGYSPWTRSGTLNITPSQLPKTIEVMAQPYVEDADGVNTLQINLPSKGDFEQYYHVPGINDQQAADNDLPHIESFEFIVFLDHFESAGKDDKIIVSSEANWMPMYGNQNIHHYDGIYTVRKKDDTSTPHRSVFKFRKLIQGSTTGPWDGYTLVSQDANLWSEIGSAYALPASIDNSQNTSLLTDDDGNHFTVIKRIQPVFATVDLLKYQLIKFSSDLGSSSGDYPEVIAGAVGEVASGFALAFDDANDTLANTGIYQIASGEFDFSTVGASVGDPVYVDESTGLVTLSLSPYPCGWVINGGVVLDIDIYNASTSGGAGGLQPNTDIQVSKVTVSNSSDPLYESVLNVTNGGNTELNLVGTTNLRKVDKTTGLATDVININGTSGALDLRTDATYQGSINTDNSLVNRLYVDQMAYYKGQGLGIPASITISTNTVNQNTPVAYFENSLSHADETIIVIDESLVASETIIKISPLAQYSSKSFLLYHGATDNGEKTIRRGETWRIRLDASGTNHWVYERVDDGTRITRGLGDRLTPVEHPYVGLFQYAENMPYHLLVETPMSSRLVHEFPREKTFRFTPISTGREHDNNVVINQANQGVANADLELGQYSDLPLYVIEPNVVVNRDQRAWINFPANITLDVSAGFYAFGTVSGWCGNNTTEGNVAVYVGGSENFRSYTQNIGFVLGNTGVFILDGQNLRTAQNSTVLQFNIEPGVTHMYRYAFYVDDAGLMTYYIVDLNTGQLSTGTQQCNLPSLPSNPKLYVSYDRYGNNTAAIAIAETHLVVNSVGDAEGRWNWRN